MLKSRQHAASLSRIIVSDKVPAQSSASHLVKPDQWKQVQTRTDHFWGKRKTFSFLIVSHLSATVGGGCCGTHKAPPSPRHGNMHWEKAWSLANHRRESGMNLISWEQRRWFEVQLSEWGYLTVDLSPFPCASPISSVLCVLTKAKTCRAKVFFLFFLPARWHTKKQQTILRLYVCVMVLQACCVSLPFLSQYEYVVFLCLFL